MFSTFSIKNFSPIGKSVLHRIVGLRNNYKIYELNCPECCKDCPHAITRKHYEAFPDSKQYKDAADACSACIHGSRMHMAHVKALPIYVNEMNKFGEGTPLKINAIRLFLTYHMICQNSYGVLKNISIRELSELLDCAPKTIRYNNAILQKNDYINMSAGEYPGTVNIMLPEYSSYFKKADEGGRGFLTLSKGNFELLLNIDSTNQLRIILKLLLDDDSVSTSSEITQTFRDMQLYLPKYCKRNVIRKTLDSISEKLCNVHYNAYTAIFKFTGISNARKEKNTLKKHNTAYLEGIIRTTSMEITECRKTKQIPFFSSPFFTREQQKRKDANITYKPLKIPAEQQKDIVQLSLEYSLDLVMQAIANIYFTFCCQQNSSIQNWGAMVRTNIKFRFYETL